ncbi:hypothetical protein EJB05_34919, partial [Eragrostis curvula]
MAVLFTSRGVKCTILTTPANAAVIRSAVDRANAANAAPVIDISTVPFPNVGLPSGVASEASLTPSLQTASIPGHATPPRSTVSRGCRSSAPACSPTPAHTPCFASRHNPLSDAPDDAVVALPGLPDRVALRRSQLLDPAKPSHRLEWAFCELVDAADSRSYGEVYNSFADLEPGCVDHYRAALGRRVWLVGPLAHARTEDVAGGGLELACGLQLSGKNFLWVMDGEDTDASSQWMPKGFTDLTAAGERGLIFQGWAPQTRILNHSTVGAFVTHCGWNSALEAVSAGVPLVTWRRYVDQFYNEMLIIELLKVGVSLGSVEYASKLEVRDNVISGETIAETIGEAMGDDEGAEQRRVKAKELGAKAKRATEKGGSTYEDVGRLIQELIARRSSVVPA